MCNESNKQGSKLNPRTSVSPAGPTEMRGTLLDHFWFKHGNETHLQNTKRMKRGQTRDPKKNMKTKKAKVIVDCPSKVQGTERNLVLVTFASSTCAFSLENLQ